MAGGRLALVVAGAVRFDNELIALLDVACEPGLDILSVEGVDAAMAAAPRYFNGIWKPVPMIADQRF